MTTTVTARQLDDELKIGLRVLTNREPMHVLVLPADLNDRLIVAGLAEMTAGGRLVRTEAGRNLAESMTPKAKALRLEVAFGRGISDAAKRALDVVAHQVDEGDLIALAQEIHALSVRPTPPTPTESLLEEWIT